MSYKCLCIVEFGDVSRLYSFIDVDINGNIVQENLDVSFDKHIIAKHASLSLYNQKKQDFNVVLSLEENNPVDIFVTNSRIILACKKYDKGGTWYGGFSALVLTGIERAVASAKRKNKILTGLIRYEWIYRIGYTRKTRMLEDETLNIDYYDDEKNLYRLEIEFNKGIDSSFIANEILHFACKYRLAMTDEKSENEINFLKKYLRENIKYDNRPRYISLLKFPTKYYAPYGEKFKPTLQDLCNFNPNALSANKKQKESQTALETNNNNHNNKLSQNLHNHEVNKVLTKNNNNVEFCCSKCNAHLNQTDLFCAKCGTRIKPHNATTNQKENKKTCNKCGIICDINFMFCPKCGNKL